MVFTEFLDMVDKKFGEAVTEEILDASDLASGGVYTAVGTYDHSELLHLVKSLSETTNRSVSNLVFEFGYYLFGRFAISYQNFFVGIASAFEFLSQIETHVHVEVHKLYPDAELPTFECRQINPQTLELTYRSVRPFADFAAGLIQGCIDHFKEKIDVQRIDLPPFKGTSARFLLTKQY